MNAYNSVTSKATDTKFAKKNTAYHMQIKCTSNISKHAHRPPINRQSIKVTLFTLLYKLDFYTYVYMCLYKCIINMFVYITNLFFVFSLNHSFSLQLCAGYLTVELSRVRSSFRYLRFPCCFKFSLACLFWSLSPSHSAFDLPPSLSFPSSFFPFLSSFHTCVLCWLSYFRLAAI